MRIAIIGGGIGGCATAYFARAMLHNAKVNLYEKNGLGGRIMTRTIDGWARDLGATFFTSSNRIVMDLVSHMSIRTHDIGELSSIGVWDGNGFVLTYGSASLFTKLKLASKYRLGLMRLISLIQNFRKGVGKLYESAERQPGDLRNLLGETGLNSWLDRSFLDVLEEADIGSSIIKEVVEPMIRLIYNQGVEVNGFAGLTTILALSDRHLLKMSGGNISLPVKLAESSGATIKLGYRVEGIERASDDSLRVFGENFEDEHDVVVLAAPLELLGFDLDEVVGFNIQAREFQSVFTKILRGSINSKFFGLKSTEDPPRIILNASTASFSNIQTIGKTSNSQKLYSVTHGGPLSKDTLSQIFPTHETIYEHVWDHAYPVFKPGGEMPSSVLGNGIHYLNSMETAVSSMESSSFAALNAVRLIKANL